jgi:hypothetical protein
VCAARQEQSAGLDVDVVGQAQRMPASWRRDRLGQGDIEAEDEALDDVLEEHFGLVVLGAVGGKPLVIVVLAKVVQEREDGWE